MISTCPVQSIPKAAQAARRWPVTMALKQARAAARKTGPYGYPAPKQTIAAVAVIPFGPPKQRAVLAVLLLQEGRPLSYDGLVEAVWGGTPPVHVRNLVQKYISGLRRALGNGPELSWTGSGYLLTGAEAGDLRERRRLMDAALAARDAGDLRRAGELARQTEELWCGEFAEGLQAPYLAAERLRWAEKRLTVLEARLAGAIELGQSFEYVHELVRLVAAHPLRERLVELLMLALCRTGRPTDALTAYEAARQRLAARRGDGRGSGARAAVAA